MTGYAAGTEVPVDRSQAEIERTLARFGADQFVRGWDAKGAMVGFRIGGRMVRMVLPLPDPDDPLIILTAAGKRRTDVQAGEARDKEIRRRWRALLLVIKAKLTAVQDGISTIEREFLADVVLPDGSTLGAWVGPQLAKAYDDGKMPALMPGPK